MATALFYELNGHRVRVSAEDELFDLMIAVATRAVETAGDIARRLAELTD